MRVAQQCALADFVRLSAAAILVKAIIGGATEGHDRTVPIQESDCGAARRKMTNGNFSCTFPLNCVIMSAALTTNDLATTHPLKGVVSYKTGRAGAMAYLKNTSAPPDLSIAKRNGRLGQN